MDVNERRVVESLRTQFEAAQVVFWHDTDSQFAITLESLELGDDIEIVRLDQMPVLAVKRQLEQQPASQFLLYSTYPEPDPAADWLLDVRLRSKSFRADLTTLLIDDLGLTSLTLAPYIRSRSKFLGAEARRSKLKRLVESGDGETELDRRLDCVVAGRQGANLIAGVADQRIAPVTIAAAGGNRLHVAQCRTAQLHHPGLQVMDDLTFHRSEGHALQQILRVPAGDQLAQLEHLRHGRG
jgi:hypothetical protein